MFNLSRRFRVGILSTFIVPTVVGLVSSRLSAQTIGVQADIAGSVDYPDMVPGNSSQASYSDHSGFLPGGTAMATLSAQIGGIDANGTTGTGGVSGFMSATIGALHGKIGASSTSTVAGPNPGFVNGSAFMGQGDPEATFYDYPTVLNPSIPIGQPVIIHATLQLDWLGMLTDGPNADSLIEANATENIFGYANLYTSYLADSSGNSSAVPTDGIDISVPNGSQIQLTGQLQLTAEERLVGVANSAYASAVSDASDTADFYFDAVTPGTLVISTSGHDYTTPVPEPSTALIAMAGLGLLVRRRA